MKRLVIQSFMMDEMEEEDGTGCNPDNPPSSPITAPDEARQQQFEVFSI